MQVEKGRLFIGRFKTKSDLLVSLTNLCQKEDIKLGVFSVIGALTKVKLGYYNQPAKEYVECVQLNKKLEIASCIGNISLKDTKKDAKIFIHAHITLADLTGQCYGGHLMPGSIIFAAEYYIKELTGGQLNREYDPETGLNLWRY